jgi:hypothetical protein
MASVDGQVVRVGDYVDYKADMEVCGEITRINGNQITIKVDDSCGNVEYHTDSASRFWID